MIKLLRTSSSNLDFIALVKRLDKELAIRDGAEHSFYAQFNKIDAIKHVIVALENDKAKGCGAIKEYDNFTMEVKRMFVADDCRGKGIAGLILSELEKWAKELGYSACILETGLKQFEAIGLYSKAGYKMIPNYGQYQGVENSVCFQKNLD